MAEQLKKLLATLAKDSKELGSFITDPKSYLSDKDIDENEIELILSGNLNAINAKLSGFDISQNPTPLVVIVDAKQNSDLYSNLAKIPSNPGNSGLTLYPNQVLTIPPNFPTHGPPNVINLTPPTIIWPTVAPPTIINLTPPTIIYPIFSPPPTITFPNLFSNYTDSFKSPSNVSLASDTRQPAQIPLNFPIYPPPNIINLTPPPTITWPTITPPNIVNLTPPPTITWPTIAPPNIINLTPPTITWPPVTPPNIVNLTPPSITWPPVSPPNIVNLTQPRIS